MDYIVVAYIKSHLTPDVKEALEALGSAVKAYSVDEVGVSPSGRVIALASSEKFFPPLSKGAVRLEVVVDSPESKELVKKAIREHAATPWPPDGAIFSYTTDDLEPITKK